MEDERKDRMPSKSTRTSDVGKISQVFPSRSRNDEGNHWAWPGQTAKLRRIRESLHDTPLNSLPVLGATHRCGKKEERQAFI